MKKKVVQYTIAEPCHENWGVMTPMEKGRFCNSCVKPVVDFTDMTDRQVVQFMSAATASVCGRMTTHQLDRDFTLYQAAQTRSFNLRALVLGTALSTFSALHVQAQQGEVIKGKVAVQVEEPVMMGEMSAIEPLKSPVTDSIFSGNVIDYMGNVFVGSVEITIYDELDNQLSFTLSNNDGRFELPLNSAEHPYKVVFKKEEYDEAVYLVADLLATRDVTIELSREMHIIMGRIAPSKRD